MKRTLIVAVLLTWSGAGYGENYIQKNNGFIPGLYQIKTNQKIKGYTISALQAGTIAAGVYYKLNADEDKWFERYKNSNSSEEAARAYGQHRDAQDNNKWSKRFFYTAGAVYVFNFIDVLLYEQKTAPLSMTLIGRNTGIQMSFHF